jgi:hypothetical protein
MPAPPQLSPQPLSARVPSGNYTPALLPTTRLFLSTRSALLPNRSNYAFHRFNNLRTLARSYCTPIPNLFIKFRTLGPKRWGHSKRKRPPFILNNFQTLRSKRVHASTTRHQRTQTVHHKSATFDPAIVTTQQCVSSKKNATLPSDGHPSRRRPQHAHTALPRRATHQS